MILSRSTVIKRSSWAKSATRVAHVELLKRQREDWGSLRIEMVGKHNSRYNLARVLALALAVLFVLFVGQALGHSHAKRTE